MPCPALAPWVKQPYPSVRFEVVRMREIPFAPIAPTTRQTQVVSFRDTTMRPRDDMVYRHGDTSLFRGTQAILTAILGSCSHEASQPRRQACHLAPPLPFLGLLSLRQTMPALLQERIGLSLQGSESLSCL
jgi:hypothetical protein